MVPEKILIAALKANSFHSLCHQMFFCKKEILSTINVNLCQLLQHPIRQVENYRSFVLQTTQIKLCSLFVDSFWRGRGGGSVVEQV